MFYSLFKDFIEYILNVFTLHSCHYQLSILPSLPTYLWDFILFSSSHPCAAHPQPLPPPPTHYYLYIIIILFILILGFLLLCCFIPHWVPFLCVCVCVCAHIDIFVHVCGRERANLSVILTTCYSNIYSKFVKYYSLTWDISANV